MTKLTDSDLNETANLLKDLTRKFSEKEIKPLLENDEKTETFRPEIIKKLGELGLTGVPISENFGGSGLGYREYIAVIEELAAVSPAYAVSVAVTGLAQTVLSIFGNEEQKQRAIPHMASGAAIGAFALTEPGAGSDAANLRSTAVKKNGNYILNGTKLFITQADSARFVIIMARTGEPGPKGVSAFLLDRGEGLNYPGFQIGKLEKKMGWHNSHTCEVILNNLILSPENLVGKEGEGIKIAMTALDCGRITIGASAVGIARAALACAISHAKIREQFGKSIGEFQGVSFMLADMATQLEAAALLVQNAATLRDAGQPFTTQAAMAKLFATDTAMKVTTDAVQVLGGSGYTQEFPVERYMRDAKVMQIVEGTNQIQRLVIGRSLLKT